MRNLFADVAIPLPSFNLFTYTIPEDLQELAKPGQRVIVPVRNSLNTGFIVQIKTESDYKKELKYIKELIDIAPILPEELLKFLMKVSDYYQTPIGKVLMQAVPKEIRLVKNRKLIFSKKSADLEKIKYQDILSYIKDKREILYSTAIKHFNSDYFRKGIVYLKRNGFIEEKVLFKQKNPPQRTIFRLIKEPSKDELQVLLKRSPKQYEIVSFLSTNKFLEKGKLKNFSRSSLDALVKKGYIKIEKIEYDYGKLWKQFDLKQKEVILTTEQQNIYNTIKENIEKNKFRCFLLHGVTGSGKTEIYIKLIKDTILKNKGVFILVPEITLTTYFAGRFRGEFGASVAIWHSNLSSQDRFTIWNQIREGKIKIVVGVRSSIFLPLQNIGLIIIDEEQDQSYKQTGMDPKYNARDAALFRAQINNATVVLGSATPSMESIYNAITRKYQKLEITTKYSKSPNPMVHIVDMKKEYEKVENIDFPLSKLLIYKIKENLKKNNQILLLQNRRGFSNFIMCLNCGWTPICLNCSITLTYHKREKKLVCHYCGYYMNPPSFCNKCGGTHLVYPGYGTEKVEEALSSLFDGISITRLDLDTARERGFTERTLKNFEKGDIQILVGTQIIAKGLDFPNIGLVGILNADVGLNLPDFRARERTFQLLYQVIGRAGRGDIKSEVVIQTFNPDNIAIKYAAQFNFKIFQNLELSERIALNYPPFSRMANIIISNTKSDAAKAAAIKIKKFLDTNKGKVDVIGPAEAPIFKMKNRYRYMILIKSSKKEDPKGIRLRTIIKNLLNSSLYHRISRKSRISIDIDPLDLL